MVIRPKKKREIYDEYFKSHQGMIDEQINNKITEYYELVGNYEKLINKKKELIKILNNLVDSLEGELLKYDVKVELINKLNDICLKTLDDVNMLNQLEEKISNELVIFNKLGS